MKKALLAAAAIVAAAAGRAGAVAAAGSVHWCRRRHQLADELHGEHEHSGVPDGERDPAAGLDGRRRDR